MTPLVRVPTRLSRSWRADAGRSAVDWLLVARLHADCRRHSVEFRAAVVLPVHDGQSTAACTVVVAQRDSRRQPAHVHLYQVVEARQRLADVLVCVCVCVCVCVYLSFDGHFPGGPGLARTRMSPFLILVELRMMQVVVTTGAIRRAKLQSNDNQQTSTSFLQARCPSCRPANSSL